MINNLFKHFLLIGLGIFLASPTFSAENTTIFTGKVVRVFDGDTIAVLNSQKQQVKVRLYGIDAPEKH